MSTMSTSSPASKFVGIRIPHDLMSRIDADATASGRSVSNLIKYVLTAHYATIDALADADAPSL